MAGNLRAKLGFGKNMGVAKPTATPQKPIDKPKAPSEAITYACGCIKAVKDIITKNCEGCKIKKQQELIAAQKKAAMERNASRIQTGKKTYWKNEAFYQIPRLPNGSQFVIEPYNAEKQLWKGKLLVPLEEGTVKEFTYQHTALFKLEYNLDRLYREWLAVQNPTEEKQE